MRMERVRDDTPVGPIILGCDKIAHKGPIPPKEFSSWDEFKKLFEECETKNELV